jgi:4-amino-4-deoxy-L-arabinose transferase-like glycosyltransferase
MVTKNETRRTIDPPIRRPWQTRALLGILIVGAIIRVALWVAWSEWSPLINDDARDYENLAARLVTTGTYSSERGERISLRPPGYPAAVAAIYGGFGLKNNDAVRAVQATLGLATTLLVYRIATIAYSRSVGLWAAAITCFYPPLLGYANLILSETLFTFLTTSFAWLICEAILRERIAILIAAGLLMGLAALTRSIMLLFVPIIGMMLLVGWRGNGSRRLLAAVLPQAAYNVLVLQWANRNTPIQQTKTIIYVIG